MMFCLLIACLRSRPGKPNQRKGQNEKFMNFAHFCEFWCFSLGKQARFTLNFCSGMPLRKVHEPTFLWFGLPGPLLIVVVCHCSVCCYTMFCSSLSSGSLTCNCSCYVVLFLLALLLLLDVFHCLGVSSSSSSSSSSSFLCVLVWKGSVWGECKWPHWN